MWSWGSWSTECVWKLELLLLFFSLAWMTGDPGQLIIARWDRCCRATFIRTRLQGQRKISTFYDVNIWPISRNMLYVRDWYCRWLDQLQLRSKACVNRKCKYSSGNALPSILFIRALKRMYMCVDIGMRRVVWNPGALPWTRIKKPRRNSTQENAIRSPLLLVTTPKAT